MKPSVTLVVLLSALSAAWASAQVPAGGEFQVNTYTTNSQSSPALAFAAAGNFVVAWVSFAADGSGYDVFAQRYDASGTPRGSEFLVNSHTTTVHWSPSVASDAAGNFVVTWTSEGQDGSLSGVFAQRFDASGAPRGAEFQVNTYTTSVQRSPTVASNAAGDFVVAWASAFQDGDSWGVFAQRFDASGTPRGAEFRVNAFSVFSQLDPSVTSDAAGNFVVAWTGWFADGSGYGVDARRYDPAGQERGYQFLVNRYWTATQSQPSVASAADGDFVVAWSGLGTGGDSDGDIFAERYDASGTRRGSEFLVNAYTTGLQWEPSVASDAAGNFVVTWSGLGDTDVFARRYDASGAPRGEEFQVNTYTTSSQYHSVVASDSVGNFVIVWASQRQDGSNMGVFGQRFGGIVPAALAVDTGPSSGSDGNGVLEPGESVDARPSWRNVNGVAQTFDGSGLGFTGPAASGVSYALHDAVGAYGTVADGTTVACTDCYRAGVTFGGTRPSLHWDATLTERLTPDVLGQTKQWSIHVGESFSDVPKTSPYYRDIETLLHKGVTGGCSATAYCPASGVTREQMSVFTLEGREGAGYRPPACTTPMFADVPASSFFCGWIEELARRGVVSGCGGGNYCPGAAVTREQLPVFVLRLLDPTLDPPACTTPVFADVPASSPFCRWIEELARRGVVGGCGGGNYCPTSPVPREQMAVFITGTYGLSLYGP